MTGEVGTFRNPALEKGSLFRRDTFAGLRGRHHVVGIAGGNAADQVTGGRVAGNHGGMPAQVFPLTRHCVQSQAMRFLVAAFALLLVGAVTEKAVLRKNRANIAVEVDSLRRSACGGRGRNQRLHGDEERCEGDRETNTSGADAGSSARREFAGCQGGLQAWREWVGIELGFIRVSMNPP
jgi:hypothetical protein